jgi:hypothetical protein
MAGSGGNNHKIFCATIVLMWGFEVELKPYIQRAQIAQLKRLQ